jgi:hypothetical protein
MEQVRLLHLSDLHLKSRDLSNPKYRKELNRLLGRLVLKVGEIVRAEHCKFDHIVISGDLADEHSHKVFEHLKQIIKSIMTAAGVASKECVHIVPGECDIDACDEAEKRAIDSMIEQCMDGDSPDLAQTLMERRFGRFLEFCRDFYGQDNPWDNALPFGVRAIANGPGASDWDAFIYLNSALFLRDEQDANLFAGLQFIWDQLLNSLEQLKRSHGIEDFNRLFIVSHHSAEAISQIDDFLEKIRSEQQKRYWLFGHDYNKEQGGHDYELEHQWMLPYGTHDRERGKRTCILQAGNLTGSSGYIPRFSYDIIGKNLGEIERIGYRFDTNGNRGHGLWENTKEKAKNEDERPPLGA